MFFVLFKSAKNVPKRTDSFDLVTIVYSLTYTMFTLCWTFRILTAFSYHKKIHLFSVAEKSTDIIFALDFWRENSGPYGKMLKYKYNRIDVIGYFQHAPHTLYTLHA